MENQKERIKLMMEWFQELRSEMESGQTTSLNSFLHETKELYIEQREEWIDSIASELGGLDLDQFVELSLDNGNEIKIEIDSDSVRRNVLTVLKESIPRWESFLQDLKERIGPPEEPNYFTQLCVWQGCVVEETVSGVADFENKMAEDFEGVRVKYAEQALTNPDPGEEKTGGRNDLFFFVHSQDINKFAVPRIKYGIRWWEDVLGNGQGYLYPNYILKKYPNTWKSDEYRKETED